MRISQASASQFGCNTTLREAFPESRPYHYAILVGDAGFGKEVTDVLTTEGMKPVRISLASS